MSRLTTVEVRGEQVDVEFTDHGYEPDTNAHDIDWDFTDRCFIPDLTDEEFGEVMRQIYEAAAEPDYWDDDVF